jgi:hypothetical protein
MPDISLGLVDIVEQDEAAMRDCGREVISVDLSKRSVQQDSATRDAPFEFLATPRYAATLNRCLTTVTGRIGRLALHAWECHRI